MNVVKQGYLDKFLKPISEGGTGLPSWIVDNVMISAKSYGEQDVKDALGTSDRSDEEKNLSLEDLDKVLSWMIGRTIQGVTIEKKENSQLITYSESIWATEWVYPERLIRSFMTKDRVVDLMNDYPELGVYVKQTGIPSVMTQTGTYMYFEEVYPEHKVLLESYGAVFQDKPIV